MGRKPLSEKHQKIIELYQDDAVLRSIRDVAEIVEVAHTTVYRVLSNNGVLRTKSEAQKKALEIGKTSMPPSELAHSEEAQTKKSKALKEHWKGKSDEEKKKISKRARKQWNNRTEEEKAKFEKSAAIGRLKAAKDGSKLERGIAHRLKEAGFSCWLHRKDMIPNQNLEIDIYIPDLKCAVEIDGPGHFLPIWGQDKLQKQQKADREKDGQVINSGCHMIRVKCISKQWTRADEVEAFEKIVKVLEKIQNKPEMKKKVTKLEVNGG